MAGETGDIFDVRRIRRLVELMREFDLREIDLKNGEQEVRLARGPEGQIVAAPHATPPMASAPVHSPPAASTSALPPAAAPATVATTVDIRSPMVGTFYASPNPQAPPFVKVGDHVGVETIVCLIEAMKVFNEIPAEVSGKIVAVLVQSGDSVEFGQPLFRVDPNG